MNHTYRLVYNAALNMFVVASELARARGKGGSGADKSIACSALSRATGSALIRQFKLSLGALAMLLAHGLVHGQQLPAGAILDINSGTASNTGAIADTFRDYSVSFTAGQTGSNYLLFAFRQDPAYWTFGNVSLIETGTTTNLLINPNFTQGGSVGSSGIQAPANWGIVYQTGSPPTAAGTWNAPGTGDSTSASGLGVNTSTSGSWYDGAVGSFDGIYQGVSLTGGVSYTVSFSALSNDNANTSSVRMGVFAGPCLSLMTAAAECRLDSSTGFTTLYQPSETNNAGAPANTVIASPTNAADLTATNIFDGGTMVADGTTLDGRNYSITGNHGVIDTHGYNTVISTPITDDSAGTPGGLGVTNTTGSGRLTLSGVNTYTGGTTVSQGANLTLTGDGSIAASSGLTNNGTFNIAGTNQGAAVTSLFGNGNVVLGAQDLTLTNATGTFAGSIAGTGGLNVNGGHETLSGTNSYTGATTIANGATLSLSGSGSVASSSRVDTNGTLDIAGTAAGASITSLSGNGTVALGSQNLTLTQANDTFGGAIGGTGGVNVAGGTQTLSGNNTYTGATSITTGATLNLTGNGTVAASGNVDTNGTLNIAGTMAGTSIQTLNGNGAVVLGSRDLTLTNASGSFGGVIGGAGDCKTGRCTRRFRTGLARVLHNAGDGLVRS